MNTDQQVACLQLQNEQEEITFTIGEKIYISFVIGLIVSAIEFFLLLW